MVKLVITDVDNTIVKEATGNLHPDYITTIKELRKKGIYVVIASGRQLHSIQTMFHEVLDDIFCIGDGGAVIKAMNGIETLSPIPREWVSEIWKDVQSIPGMDAMLCAPDRSYAHDETSEMFQLMVQNYKYRIDSMHGWEHIPDVPIPKISLYRATEVEAYGKQFFIPKWQDKLHISLAGEWWIDCLMPGTNKGTALKHIIDSLDILPEEVLATGDNMNDLEMLKLAGRGLCVENGNEKLKSLADGIIPAYDRLGVLHEWQKLL